MLSASLAHARRLCAVLHLATLLTASLCGLTAAQAREVVYVVDPGDKVWTIARQHLKPGKTQALLDYNAIEAPQHLRPGTRLRIPVAWLSRGNRPAEVVELAGTVNLIGANGNESAVQAGSLVKAPAKIRTGAQSGATLHFPDGSRMLIGEDSQVQLQKSRYVPLTDERDVRLGIPAGKVESDVASQKARPGRFEIRTPSGVAAVRGTRFRISSQPGITHAEVIEGKVAIGDRHGRQTALAAGYGLAIQDGRNSAVIELLAPPQIAAANLLVEQLPVDLPLPDVAGAVAYRTQVAPPGRLSTSLSDQRVDAPAIRIVEIPDGNYQLRIRAIDRHGLEGAETVRPLIVNTRPPAPFTVAPKPEAALSDARPKFSWSRQASADAYHFQLAANPEFSPLLFEDDYLKAPEYQATEELPEGSFFWRVAALSSAEGRGPFSTVERFQRVPPPPGKVDPGSAPGMVRWQKQGDARYHVQLAANPEVSSPLIDRIIDEPQIEIDELPAGNYYLRIQTLGRTGLNSAWSDVQMFNVESRFDWRYLLLTIPLLLLL